MTIVMSAFFLNKIKEASVFYTGREEKRCCNTGAQLLLLDGLGHDVVTYGGAWHQIVEAIAAHTLKANKNK